MPRRRRRWRNSRQAGTKAEGAPFKPTGGAGGGADGCHAFHRASIRAVTQDTINETLAQQYSITTACLRLVKTAKIYIIYSTINSTQQPLELGTEIEL